jgi:hypothetical protein
LRKGQNGWPEVGGRGKMEGGGGEEIRRGKKKKKKNYSDVAFHVMVWGFGCEEFIVSVAALIHEYHITHVATS